METTNDQENFYRENGWAHLDFGSIGRITTGKCPETYWLSQGQVRTCEQYRKELDNLWLTMGGGKNQNAIAHRRSMFVAQSKYVQKFINDNLITQQVA